MRFFLLILLIGMAIVSGCNNPKGGSSVPVAHTPGLQPPGAFGFNQIRSQSGNVAIRWARSPRASSYSFFMGTVNTDISTPVPSCSGTSPQCNLTGLDPNTTYYFSVTAVNAAGSREVTAAGVALSVGTFDITSNSVGDGTINLTWSSATNATAYDVIYGTSTGSYPSIATNVTSPYALTGLSNGVRYYVRVVARNSQNGYGLSDSEINEQPFGPPPAPTGVAVTAVPGQATLTWNTAPGANSYKIFRGTTSGSYTQIASGVTTSNYVDTTVANGTTYFYAVRSFNGFDSVAYSAEVSVRPVEAFTISTVVTGPGANQITTTWPAVSGAAAYDIRYGTNPLALSSTATNVTSPHTLSGLTGNVTYYVRVVARNAVGAGTSVTSTNQLSAIPVPALPAPTGLTAAASPGQIVLNWNSVSGATSYEVRRGTVSGTHTTLATGIVGNTYTDTTAANGTAYYYVVRAFNGLSSPNSNEAAAKPIATFALVSVTPASATSLQITWGSGAGADAYDVLYGTVSGSYASTASNVTSPYTLTGLSANTTYYLVVRGRNSIGSGTNLLTGQGSAKTKTTAPASLTANADPGQITLDWAPTAGATTYSVYRGTASGTHTLLQSGIAASDFTDTSVTNGTSYYYVVTADNGSESANSSEVAAKPIAAFSLTSVTALSPSSVQVTWPAVAGGDAFDVRYGTTTGSYSATLTNRTSPFTITGLTGSTTYYVIVVAKNSTGTGTTENSNELSALTPVGPPSGVAATPTTGQITVSWLAMAGASSYKVYRGTTTGSYSLLQSGIVTTNYVDTTVTPGTQYFYVVKSFNGADSADSSEVTAKTIAPFTLTSVTALSPTSLQVTFPATAGGDAFDVRYGTSSGSYTSTASGVTSPYTISGLTANTTYYVVARARNAVGPGASETSNEISIRTPVTAPSGLAAASTPGSVSLTWSAVTGASSYNVYRGTTAGTTTLLASGVTSPYIDSTVTNGTTYYYAVTAFNGSESAKSSEVATQPIASHSISALSTPTSTSVQVTWNAVTGATAYDVLWGTTSGTYPNSALNQTSPYTITGLTANTTYYVVVRAKNAVGAGTTRNSTEASIRTLTTAPTGLTASANPGQVGLNWTAVTGASSYSVYRGTTSGSLSLLASSVGTTAYLDTTVTNGTTYYYAVTASNGNESAPSSEVSVRPIAAFSISSISAASSTSLSISWAAAAGASSYDIRYGTSTGVYLFTVSNVTSSYTLTGLNPNTQYFVVVRANNSVGAGTSVQTMEVNATTATGAPAGLSATPATGQIDLAWTAASGATNYRIYRGTTSGSYTQIASGITGTSYSDTTVTNGTRYYYVVRSFNGGESPDSTEVTAKTIAAFTVGSTSSPTSTSIQVSWTNPAGGDDFDVRYGTVSGTYTTASNVSSPYTITSLTANTTYYIVVRARNSIGTGASVQTPEVTQRTATIAPTGLVASATPGSVSLSWTATSGATSYNVYRGTSTGSYSLLASSVGTNAYTDTTVVNGTIYYYAVTANNGSESAYSNEAVIRPIPNFSITSATTVSTTQIDVVWPAVSGATAFDVKYGTTSGTYTTTLTNQSSPVSLSGLSPGSTYYIVVVARNSTGPGTSVQSAEVSAQTAFGAPGGVTISATPGIAQISWATVSGAASYKIFRSTTAGTYGAALATGLTSTTYTDSTVSNGTRYYYVVRAVTAGGADSPDSSEVTITPISTFAFTSATPASSTAIDLVWASATGATAYDVRYGTATGSYTTTVTNVTSPYSLSGLSANTTYYIQIVARNSVGPGTTVNSSERSAKTATANPSGLTASASTGQIQLNWSSTSGASNYNIYRSTTSGTYGAALATNVSGTTYTDSTVANGTQYYYVIRANNGIESGNSNEATALPIAAFSLTSVVANSTTSLVVTWPATAGASTYDVRYGTATGSYSTTLTNRTSPFTITGLTTGTTYYVVVRANNAIGSGATAQTAEVSAVTPLGAPSGLAATSTPGTVNLTWGSVSGASGYRVYRSTTSGSGYALIGSPGSTSYSDTTVTNGTPYYYVVTSFNGSESAYSTETSATAIANFSITLTGVSSTSIQVSWTNPAGGATYDIRYGTATGSYSTTVSNQTSPYTITGLTGNTMYYVVVRANNSVGAGTSVTSSESSLRTATGAPANLTASATPNTVSLNWDDTSGATSYKVFRSTTSGSYGAALATGVATSAYTDSSVFDGTTYYYRVVASNGSDSAPSSEVSVQSISSFSLTAATPASSTSIDLTWGPATGAAAYDIRYGTTSGVYLWSVTNVSSPYTLTGLSPNTRYYVSIRARNAVGAGTNFDSNEMNALTALGNPSGLAGTATPGTVNLTWPAVSGASSYNVYRALSSGGPYTQIASGLTALTYNDTGRTNGTSYYYVIRAFNGIESGNSNEVAIQPIASFTISSVTVNSSSQVTVSWAAAAGAASYDVRYGTASGTYSTTVSNVTSSYAVTGLSASTLYYFVVRANNAVGAGTTFTTAEVTGRTATAAPTTLAATAGTGTVNLSWVAASGATNYNVYRGTSSGVYSLLQSAVAGTTYVDNTVINGTTYYYVVRAFNGTESVNSNEATVTPIGSFSITATTATATTIQVTWGAASGATAYDVKVGTVSGTYTQTFAGVSSPYTITGRTANTTYYIIVTARNGSGGSVNSAEVSQITALGAPAGLVATGGSGSVSLDWNDVSGASSYKVHRGTTSGSLTVIATGVTASAYTDNTVSNGTTYFYAVTAFNGADSALSSEVSKQPIAQPVISSVVGNTTTSIQLTWAAATGAATYDVQWGTVSGTYSTTLTNVTSPYAITGLTSGVTYYVRLRANNAVGGGTTVFSAEASGSPNSPPVLSSIADQTTEVGVALPVNFTLSDSNHVLTCAGSMSGSSSNTTVLPNGNIAFSGTLPNCTVTLTPAAGQVGTSSVTITANDGVTSTARTFNFTTQPCTVASIVWETQPTGMSAGNLFGTAPRVSLRKADNSLCTTNFDPVVIDIVDDNSIFQDAEITAGESVIPSGGYAHFTAARMERAGSNYTINATQGSVQSNESNTFNVTAGTAVKLVWQQQPLSSLRSATIIPNPVVRTADTYGNYVANASSITVTVSLQNNEEGATLAGTLSRSSTNTYTYSNLNINRVGQYVLRATTTAFGGFTLDSEPFDVLVITNQNTVAVLDLLQMPIIHSPGASANTYYRRAATWFGTTFHDGTLSYEFQVVATNTSGTTGTIRLTSGTTTVSSVTVPSGTTTPTLFTSTTFTSVPSSTSNIRLYALGQALTITSARIVVRQTNASKTQLQIPLTMLPSNVTSISVPYAASQAASVQPNPAYFPSFYFDKAKIGRIDSVIFGMTYKSQSGVNTCASLWNKDTNTVISAERCGSSTSETMTYVQFSSPLIMPDAANIEVRVRNGTSGRTTEIYKVLLIVRLVNITDMISTQVVAPAVTGLSASTDFTGHRVKSWVNNYGTATVNSYLSCGAKANTSGSGTFVLKDHGANNSGTASSTNVTASTLTFTNQSAFTTLTAGPLATSDGNRMFVNYTHSSGNFDFIGCIFWDEATY